MRTNTYKTWTAEEAERFDVLVKAKASLREVTAAFPDRTPIAVRVRFVSRRRKFGLNKGPASNAWTTEDLVKLARFADRPLVEAYKAFPNRTARGI